MNLVLIEKSRYTFFSNREKIVTVEGNMDKQELEFYRKNPKKLLEILESDDNEWTSYSPKSPWCN